MAQTDLALDSLSTISCDAALIEQVRAKLSRVLNDCSNIDVRARGSVVTLVGQIRDSAQGRAASLLTHRVDGVTNVVNKLTIGRGPLGAVPSASVPRKTGATRKPRSVKVDPQAEPAAPVPSD